MCVMALPALAAAGSAAAGTAAAGTAAAATAAAGPAAAATASTTMLAIQTAVSIGSAVMAFVGQKQAAKKQEKAAMTAYNNDRAQLEEQRRQEGLQARQQMSERGKQALFERARLRAASAEGGVGGNSIDRIFNENSFAAGQDMATMQENARNGVRQSMQQGEAMRSTAQSRLNAIERPSMLSTGLQIAGIGADAYSKYKKIN